MWTAIYTDDSRINQYNKDGSENLFKDIDQNRLNKFIVSNNKAEAIVNIKTGEIKVNGVKLDFGYNSSEHRLIYFRRVRQTLGNNTEPDINEFVGWQTTIQGSDGLTNIKRVICLEDIRKITIQCD